MALGHDLGFTPAGLPWPHTWPPQTPVSLSAGEGCLEQACAEVPPGPCMLGGVRGASEAALDLGRSRGSWAIHWGSCDQKAQLWEESGRQVGLEEQGRPAALKRGNRRDS